MLKKYLNPGILFLIVLAVLISCTPKHAVRDYQPATIKAGQAASHQLLVETEWLASMGSTSKLRLIDYGRKIEAYQKGHIPGAVFIERKAVWDKVNGIPGMLPGAETMVAALEKAGISNDSMVIIYDGNSGLWASRLFWALEYLGHRDTHILNGGWSKWIRENREVQKAADMPPPAKFTPHIQHDLLATQNWVLNNLENPDVQIIDTRSSKEYTGDDVRAARGGHIPGAMNINWISNLKGDGSKTFLRDSDLAKLYDSRKVSKEKQIVTHCQTGVRGTHTYVVLKLLGYPNVRVYDGSWAEWGNNPETPIISESMGQGK
jgi:thiosulfate/3-mercaptopyruvate sulfurtransferase